MDKQNTVFVDKKEFNILNFNFLNRYLKKKKYTHLIHIAGLSRPMSIHENEIEKSINLNIIGTANIVKACKRNKIKLIYFSTSYVYPGKKGNYSENDDLNPINNYAWSKLGGECAVHMYKNSLILRLTMCERPFTHKQAFYDVNTNFIYHDEVAKIIPKILKLTGILNVGGKTQSVFNFAKKYNKKIKKISAKKNSRLPLNQTMNLMKLKKILWKK